MDFSELFSDKATKGKEKVEILSKWLADHPQELDSLIAFAQKAKDPVKASCIEAIEFVVAKTPQTASSTLLEFVTGMLTEKAPRVKWESAKVIGHMAHRFPEQLDQAITGLLANTEHTGTVVRWSAAFALGEILKLKTARNTELIPAVENICSQEEKNSIKKILQQALKAVR